MFKNKPYELLNGDCLELMKDIPDKGIDMVLCDLPYGITQCEWDICIPFEPLWEEYNRIIKSNGAICLFGSEPFSSYLRISNIKMYKYDWIWEKGRPTCFHHAKNMPMKKHENICVFSKGLIKHKGQAKRMIYNPQGIELYGKEENGASSRGDRDFYGHRFCRPSHHKYIRQYKNYPTSILNFKDAENTVHPTQKPVALLEYLIKTYTNEGEIVLDNCMGSGSTGVACINTGRKFIGIELDEKYFEIAKQRIEGG